MTKRKNTANIWNMADDNGNVKGRALPVELEDDIG